MRRLFIVLAVVWGALVESANARATCCNTDADCPPGIACARGACNAVTSCTCDTDCGSNLHCVPAVVTVCSGSGGQDCHPEGRCASAWQRPCETAADCGPGGFTCVANGELCSAAGCQTTSMCQPPTLPSTCAIDSDCPPAWTCEADTAVITACISETRFCPEGGCPPPTGAKSCVPPLFDLVGPVSYAGPPVVLPNSCPTMGAGGAAGTRGDGQGGAGGATAAAALGGGGSGPPPQAGGAGPSSGGCQVVPGAPANVVFCVGFATLLAASARGRAKRPAAPPAL